MADEIERAQAKYPPFHSLHEAESVLREEMDELWEQIKIQQNRRYWTALQTEAIHVGAMIARLYVERLGSEADAREITLYRKTAP